MQQELESAESKKTSQLKQLEKSNKILKQEKEDALRVIYMFSGYPKCLIKERKFSTFFLPWWLSLAISLQDLKELQDRYKSQTKDLRDAIAQRKIAMEEFTDINER